MPAGVAAVEKVLQFRKKKIYSMPPGKSGGFFMQVICSFK